MGKRELIDDILNEPLQEVEDPFLAALIRGEKELTLTGTAEYVKVGEEWSTKLYKVKVKKIEGQDVTFALEFIGKINLGGLCIPPAPPAPR